MSSSGSILDRAVLLAVGSEHFALIEEAKGFLGFLADAAEWPLPRSHPITARRIALDAPKNLVSSLHVGRTLLALFGWGRSLMSGELDIDLAKELQLRKRLANPSQYLDLEAEFATASLLLDRGWRVKLVEDEGKPDIYVPEESLWIEVKRSANGSNPESIHRRKLAQANKKFRPLVEECYVLLFISRGAFDPPVIGGVPDDIQPYLTRAETSLSRGLFRSIDGAALVWDDIQLSMNSPAAGFWAFRRQLTHVDARPLRREALSEVGQTVGLGVRFGLQDVELRALFRSPITIEGSIALLGVHPDLIMATLTELRRARGRAWVQAVADHQGMILACSDLRADGSAVIGILHHLDDAPLVLRGLYRIGSSLHPDPANPAQAFDRLLKNSGRQLGLGSHRGAFIQVADIELGDIVTFVHLLDADGNETTDPLIHSPDRRGAARSYWLHALKGAKLHEVRIVATA